MRRHEHNPCLHYQRGLAIKRHSYYVSNDFPTKRFYVGHKTFNPFNRQKCRVTIQFASRVARTGRRRPGVMSDVEYIE